MGSRFNNPYSMAYFAPQTNVRRTDLSGSVEFMEFPVESLSPERLFDCAPPLHERPEGSKQVFLGQVPFRVTDGMVEWMFRTLANTQVLYVDRIIQENNRRGCMQIVVDGACVADAIEAINKRVLFDENGIWYARDWEIDILEAHCNNSGNSRFQGLPFRTVVLEESKSLQRRAPLRRSPQPQQGKFDFYESEMFTSYEQVPPHHEAMYYPRDYFVPHPYEYDTGAPMYDYEF